MARPRLVAKNLVMPTTVLAPKKPRQSGLNGKTSAKQAALVDADTVRRGIFDSFRALRDKVMAVGPALRIQMRGSWRCARHRAGDE